MTRRGRTSSSLTLVAGGVGMALALAGCGAAPARGSAPTLTATTISPVSASPVSTSSSSRAPISTPASSASTSVTAPATTRPPRTTTAPATATVPRTTTTTAGSTTTVAALPSSPQATPDAAATVFVDDWKAGNRTGAASIATAKAVSALFASPYAGQTVIDRSCSADFVPRVCSWGDYGGGSGPLYEIYTRPSGANWYVSGATVGP